MNFINAILKSATNTKPAVEPTVNTTPVATEATTLSFHELSYVGGGQVCSTVG